MGDGGVVRHVSLYRKQGTLTRAGFGFSKPAMLSYSRSTKVWKFCGGPHRIDRTGNGR